MAIFNNFKVEFTQSLAQQTKKIITNATQHLLPQDNTLAVSTTIANSGSSLKIVIKGRDVVTKEFGNFHTPAKPWVATLQRQIKPILSGLFSSNLNLKK